MTFLFAAFLVLNLLAAHFMSDCGLPAAFGLLNCSDDIVRAGWPLQFYEQGGLAYRSAFDAASLLVDVLSGLGASVLIALGSLLIHRRR